MYYAKPLGRLVAELEKLPGIGPKSAQRLAFYLMRVPAEEARLLIDAIREVKEQMRECRVCFNVSDTDLCPICANERRDRSLLCVVADPRDLIALEKTGEFKGVYHVLGGVIDPTAHVGPDDLHVRELVERVAAGGVQEVVLAVNPSVEGDATALYVWRLLKPFDVRVSKIAFGLPVGGDLDYADQATLIQALEGRREMK
jgi:recombination protein RecR